MEEFQRNDGASRNRSPRRRRTHVYSIRRARKMLKTKPDKGWAWMIVLGITIINLSVLPVQQCFGLIFEQRFSSIGISATQASLILHLNGTVCCCLGLMNGPLMKKFSFRKVAFCGGCTVAIGICSTAFSVSLVTIVLSYCVIVAIGQGMIYPATTLAMNTYFREKRKVAMGLTVTLTALGPIIMPLLIAKLLESYASTGTILILSGIATHSLIGALLLKPFTSTAEIAGGKNGDEEVSLNQTEDAKEESPAPKSNNPNELANGGAQLLESKTEQDRNPNSAPEDNQMEPKTKENRRIILKKIAANLDLDLLRDNRYLTVIIGMAISFVAETNFNATFPFVLRELTGLGIPAIAKIMSIQAVADIAGRLCVPLIAQKTGWSVRSLYIVSLLGSTLGRTLLTTWGDLYTVIVAVSLVLGVSKGTKAVFQALIIPDLVPLEKLPAASGIMMAFSGVLSIAVGPLIGLVHDSTDSYVGALYFTSILSLSCVFLWFLGGLWTPISGDSRKPTEEENNSAIV